MEEIAKLKPIDKQFPDGNYPAGEISEYPVGKDERTAVNRITSEEKKVLDDSYMDVYKDFRRAAESHRQTRKYVKSWVKPGMSMIDIWLVAFSNMNNMKGYYFFIFCNAVCRPA